MFTRISVSTLLFEGLLSTDLFALGSGLLEFIHGPVVDPNGRSV
ncbi:MAG: hypothetical protein AAGD01_09390 [Acidobacteriota bacterium]